ncbi:hypothetical protein FW778_05865 [Ginsengibacter hankyongi]|uniref:Uncharacterized protein n=1 Tax=Ginsengibacter hankyongi TaxID=2607284 RepID=A0A5J5INI1_9BACT|nr:hypothetical protein [Ginsengibacter hankyongi]KAA9041547.1 hypothetical protein FW778_05865 [Ginsengibacter hankyongi]
MLQKIILNKYFFLLLLFVFTTTVLFAQYDAPLYTSYTTAVERAKLHDRLIRYSINKSLSSALNDSTEENWEDAFDALEVLLYKSPLVDAKVHKAFDEVETRSLDFQKALLGIAYTNYPGIFFQQVKKLLSSTDDPKVFALCAEYLLQQKKDPLIINTISKLIETKFGDEGIINPILYMLQVHISEQKTKGTFLSNKLLTELFSSKFLPGQTIAYSIQRKNRNYPGLMIVRRYDGKFITDSNGIIFNIPQLARSITNLPFYLRGGNTPQGIFFMNGFGVSMSSFIGPTANIQLSMPVEENIKAFMRDSSITDTTWNIDYYKKLIPADLQNYLPLFYSYYAGLAGRTEIIAHGTTIDPAIYSKQPYYPLTPTSGCLCTKEIWNGKRLESDQQKLVNALLKAGGANGYCLVIELDDKQAPVTLNDIIPYLFN